MMIEWEKNMSLGIEEFNAHHKHIIDLINRLDASFKTGYARKVTRETLAELSNFSLYHVLQRKKLWESVIIWNTVSTKTSM
jgi:hemerythrin